MMTLCWAICICMDTRLLVKHTVGRFGQYVVPTALLHFTIALGVLMNSPCYDPEHTELPRLARALLTATRPSSW